MYISRETPEETTKRLLKVLAQAEFVVYDEDYVFEEFPLDGFPKLAKAGALALVRDEEVWSQLVPAVGPNGERFRIFGFHFQAGLDNSGFVGWLATQLKQRVGTGVFVVCGQNSASGGIFDYWGCPLEVADAVLREVRSLIQQGKTPRP